MLVQMWMTTEIITISPSTPVEIADRLMREHGIRRLPVVEGERLLGIVSHSDINRAMPSVFDPDYDEDTPASDQDLTAESLMTMSPLSLRPDDSIALAARLMRERKIGSLPVLQQGRLIGMLTESDLFAAVVELMGDGQEGTLFELRIDQTPGSLHDALAVFKTFGANITHLGISPNFSRQHRLLSVTATGERLEELAEHLWQQGFSVNRILQPGTPGR